MHDRRKGYPPVGHFLTAGTLVALSTFLLLLLRLYLSCPGARLVFHSHISISLLPFVFFTLSRSRTAHLFCYLFASVCMVAANVRVQNDCTALIEAPYYGHFTIVKLLLDAGADMEAKISVIDVERLIEEERTLD